MQSRTSDAAVTNRLEHRAFRDNRTPRTNYHPALHKYRLQRVQENFGQPSGYAYLANGRILGARLLDYRFHGSYTVNQGLTTLPTDIEPASLTNFHASERPALEFTARVLAGAPILPGRK